MKTITYLLAIVLLALINPTLAQADVDALFESGAESPIATPAQDAPQIESPQSDKSIQELTQQTKKTKGFQFEFTKQNLYLYRYEVFALFAVFAYIIIYQRGKNANYMMAAKFYEKTQEFIKNNFAHTGFSREEDGFLLASQSANQLLMYASGRQHCEYMEISFKLRKRQDLIYYVVYQTIYPEKDMIVIDIPVQVNHPIVLCVAQKKKIKSLTEKNIDLAKLAGSFEIKNLNSNYGILGQSSEIVDHIIDNHVARKLHQLTGLVMCLHYTDQKMFSDFNGHFRAIFYASNKNQEKYLAGLQLIFYLIDRICRMKVSVNYKTKAINARQAFNATKQKQALERHKQELRKKKQDKKRQQQAWLRSLPPEKQKREDEKRKKKEMNKMLKSKTMKVM